MRLIAATVLSFALALLAACSQPAPPRSAEAETKPAAPAIPAEISSVAQSVLGSEAEVMVYGDLARTGQQQVLVINRLARAPTGTVPGNLVTRVVVAEQSGGKWKEVLRCDEHLKNPEGFLGGTLIAPVTGRRSACDGTPRLSVTSRSTAILNIFSVKCPRSKGSTRD